MEASTISLHHQAARHVLERFLVFGELGHERFQDLIGQITIVLRIHEMSSAPINNMKQLELCVYILLKT